MDVEASTSSTYASTSTRRTSVLLNGHRRDASLTSLNFDEQQTSRSNRMSIIDDALVNSVTSTSTRFDKRRSTASLMSLAGDGALPLPVTPIITRDSGLSSYRLGVDSIEEDPHADKISSRRTDGYSGSESPTRSRIPVSSVGHARALADEPGPFSSPPYTPEADIPNSSGSLKVRYSLPSPDSPGGPMPSSRRISLITGGTSRVLTDLQAGVEHAKKALENTKTQLRASQRGLALLTRQTEDLKEGRDRLRLENEGLNNVVARKERLLQEVLERARKAEADAANLKAVLKETTAETKKSIREMEVITAEAANTSQKAEREYVTLKSSVQGMLDGWKSEINGLHDDVRKKEEQWAREREDVALKFQSLLKLQQAAQAERTRLASLKAEALEQDASFGRFIRQEIEELRQQFADNHAQSAKTAITADYVASELARIQRLMQKGTRTVDG